MVGSKRIISAKLQKAAQTKILTCGRYVVSAIRDDLGINTSMNDKSFVIRPANLNPQVTASETFPIDVNHHRAVKQTYATLDRLEVLSEVIDLDDDHTHEVPIEEQPVDQPVNDRAELRDLVNRLKQQIQFLQGSSDQHEVDRVIQRLASQDLETAFNNAQLSYTNNMLGELDLPFATLLATSLDTYFRAQGKVNPSWAAFISRPTMAS